MNKCYESDTNSTGMRSHPFMTIRHSRAWVLHRQAHAGGLLIRDDEKLVLQAGETDTANERVHPRS